MVWCRGYILNEATGRTIKLNSATYNKLVANGHIVDRQNGVLTPPGKGGDDSDDTDQEQQPSYTPSKTAARSRLSSGRARRSLQQFPAASSLSFSITCGVVIMGTFL